MEESFKYVREQGKSELLEILDSLRGRKCLVLENSLKRLLHEILFEGNQKVMKENKVSQYDLNAPHLSTLFEADLGRDVPDNICYLVRPNFEVMKTVSHHIRECIKLGLKCQHHIYFIPHRTIACEQILEDEGVLSQATIGEYHLGFLTLDSDLLSLELKYVYKECNIDGDYSSLSSAAWAILKLEKVVGTIPNVLSKGVSSRKILQKLLRLRCDSDDCDNQSTHICGAGALDDIEEGEDSNYDYSSAPRGLIDTLVILDREIDPFSPLVTPLTYEGLIFELMGSEYGKLHNSVMKKSVGLDGIAEGKERYPSVSQSASSSSGGGTGPSSSDNIALTLDDKDLIFAQVRNFSIEHIGPFLQSKAIEAKLSYTSFKDNKEASISEIHDFVKKIPALTLAHKVLDQHINIAEKIKQTTESREFRERWQIERGILEGEGTASLDLLEEIICSCDETNASERDGHLLIVLRLLCLLSLSNGGLRATRFDMLRKLIIQTYGYKHLYTLCNFEKAGLLRRKDNLAILESVSLSSAAAVVSGVGASGAGIGIGIGMGIGGSEKTLGTNHVINWPALKKILRLLDDSASRSTPLSDPSLESADQDLSYAAAGYAPLTARLVQLLFTPKGIGANPAAVQALRLLPGPLIELSHMHSVSAKKEDLPTALARSSAAAAASIQAGTAVVKLRYHYYSFSPTPSSLPPPHPPLPLPNSDKSNGLRRKKKKIMLVFISGGTSLLEVAAFRCLSADSSFPFSIVIASTSIMNGNTLLKSLYSE